MCEITSKVQCQDCLLYCEIGIVYCTCGKCLQPSERIRQLNKERDDVLSIRIMRWRKIRLMELDTDRLKDNEFITKPTKLSGRQTKRVTKPCRPDSWTVRVLETHWLTLYGMRTLVLHMTRAQKEDHSYVATRGERSRNEKSLHQRDDYQKAKKTCNKLCKEYAATAECGNTRIIHPQEHVRQRPNQEFEGHEEDSYRIDSETVWKYYILATMSSSPSSTWCRPSDSWWTAWNSDSSWWNEHLFLVPDVRFSLTGNSPVIDGWCKQYTVRAHFFSCKPQSLFSHLAGLKSKMKHCALSKLVHTISRHVRHYTLDEQHTCTWHLHSFPSFPSDDTTYLGFLQPSF